LKLCGMNSKSQTGNTRAEEINYLRALTARLVAV
jgi:hypothetical protein